MSAIET